jgi:hypothetical protein
MAEAAGSSPADSTSRRVGVSIRNIDRLTPNGAKSKNPQLNSMRSKSTEKLAGVVGRPEVIRTSSSPPNRASSCQGMVAINRQVTVRESVVLSLEGTWGNRSWEINSTAIGQSFCIIRDVGSNPTVPIAVRSFTGYCRAVVPRTALDRMVGRTNPLVRRKANYWSMTNHRAGS